MSGELISSERIGDYEYYKVDGGCVVRLSPGMSGSQISRACELVGDAEFVETSKMLDGRVELSFEDTTP